MLLLFCHGEYLARVPEVARTNIILPHELFTDIIVCTLNYIFFLVGTQCSIEVAALCVSRPINSTVGAA